MANVELIKEKLIRMDTLLSKLEIKGENVFLLAQARSLAKEAFDECSKELIKGDNNATSN